MNEPSFQEQADASAALELQPVMPIIHGQIDKMTETTMMAAFKDVREGKLTPERAVAYWMELHAYHRLSKRLDDKAVVTTAKGA